jgi:zinc carboxypeptidase
LRRGGNVRLAILASCLILASTAGLAVGAPGTGGVHLQMYEATVDQTTARQLAQSGFDIVSAEPARGGVRIGLVLSPSQRNALEGRGLKIGLWRDAQGKTATELAAEQAAGGYNVWKPFDGPGGIHELLYDIAQRNRRLVKLEVIGMSLGTDPEGDGPDQPREIVALKVTRDATRVADGTRPAVLYSSLQHAREWISGEVSLRLLNYYLSNYGRDAEITNLVNTRELWFVPVANPDGYQYTFDHERLWRKNLRDNNGDDQISIGDGVDPNRNWPEHFNYDNEGSSSITASETYRGTGASSEPETQALKGLLDRVGFEFQINYHSFANEILAPEGWQEGTPDLDMPIYSAWMGTDADPAVAGYDPGSGADELYITNGETTDYASTATGTLSVTPELGEGTPGSGFVFPDDETLIQEEFQRNLQFALDAARSAPDPDDPVSHLGRTTKPFYLEMDDVDPQFSNIPLVDFRFNVSYGDPQTVEVLAKKALGAVTLQYRINGGPVQRVSTGEWAGGDVFGDPSRFFHIVRGTVTGTSPGDSVEVWFTGGGKDSDQFTYTVRSDTNRDVLVVAAEDYSGISPVYRKNTAPNYLSFYLDALSANGIQADVYDIDASGRRAPDDLGVLSHYDAVIWYTGDDIITRNRGMVPGTTTRLAYETMLNIRSFLNEGGGLLFTGKNAGLPFTGYEFDPSFDRPCNPNGAENFPDGTDDCRPLYDDFLQYYLGAYVYVDGGGLDSHGHPLAINGVDTPFAGQSWSLNGGGSANNQDNANTFVATSGILPGNQYPQFTSWDAAKYQRTGGPFDPHTGAQYVYSQIADVSYKRLAKTITVPAGGGSLDFWVSHHTEEDWDFFFVEAHTVGQDNWTTLPDQNGHTSQNTGESCPAGWHSSPDEIHPFLSHYQTLNPDGTCSPTGTTGSWNASTGNSAGWQNWHVDLSPYAGQTIEVSLTYVSDWAVQGLGVFLDDVADPTGTTSFEADLGGWAVTGPALGSSPNFNDYIRTTAAGFPEGPVMASDPPPFHFRTLYMGFGFEGIADAGTRAAVMDRAMDYLLGA